MNIKSPVTFGAVVIPRKGNETLFETKGRQLVPNRAAGFHLIKHGFGKKEVIDTLILTSRDDLSPLGQSFSSAGTDEDVFRTLMHKFPMLQGVHCEPLAKLKIPIHR